MTRAADPLDRFRPNRCECPESGYTPASWAALVHSPAVADLAGILTRAEDLVAAVNAYLGEHGDSDDPGADAIRRVGLELPRVVEEEGTTIAVVAAELRGVLWALRAFRLLTDDLVPDASRWGTDGLARLPARVVGVGA